MFSAISEMAAASRRRSISSSVVRARLSTTATGFRRREGAWKRSISAGGEVVAVEVALEALLDAGPQDLDGNGAALAVVDHLGLVDLGNRRGGDGRTEGTK